MPSPVERLWLQTARRNIRMALLKGQLEDWDAAISWIAPVVSAPPLSSVTSEVTDLLTSLALTKPSDLRGNAAMRAAAIRRLEEAKTLIGETLVATTDR